MSLLTKMLERKAISIETINGCAWEWNISDNSVWWSPKVYNILGYKPQEFIPSFDLFIELLHPEDRSKVIKAIDDQLQKNKPYHLEIRMSTKNSGYKWFEAKGKVNRDEEGSRSTLVGSIVYIQGQKNLEKQISP